MPRPTAAAGAGDTDGLSKLTGSNPVIELASGIKLRLKPVSDESLRRLLVKYADQPAVDRMKAAERLYFSLGIAGVEHLPPGFPGPDSNQWIEELAAVGVDIEPSEIELPIHRRRLWLELIALEDPDDFRKVFIGVMVLSGGMIQELLDTLREVQVGAGVEPGAAGGSMDAPEGGSAKADRSRTKRG